MLVEMLLTLADLGRLYAQLFKHQHQVHEEQPGRFEVLIVLVLGKDWYIEPGLRMGPGRCQFGAEQPCYERPLDC